MFDDLGSPMADRPWLTLAGTAVVATLGYAGFQYFSNGGVDLVQTLVFGVVFAVVLAGTSLLRVRLAG